jgi:hypothetical protein
MSGYLRRLASHARNPGGAIHPVLGSLFTGAKYETLAEVPAEEDVCPRSQPEEKESSSSLARASADFERARPATLPPTHELFEASVIRSAERSDTAGTSKERHESWREERPPLRSAPVRQPEQQPTIANHPYEPLIVERYVESVRRSDNTQKILLNVSNPSTPGTVSGEKRNVSGRIVVRPEREADEIQIHIGRIEVTAVPPPVNQRASKPTRKSPSLDDYLKRGRG